MSPSLTKNAKKKSILATGAILGHIDPHYFSKTEFRNNSCKKTIKIEFEECRQCCRLAVLWTAVRTLPDCL